VSEDIVLSWLALVFALVLVPQLCPAQQPVAERLPSRYSRIGVGIIMSTLGAGIEIAKPLTQRSNLRTGFNMFLYGHPFDAEGITYNGELRLRSAELHYDWFPFGNGFHLSPGVLIYNGNKITANLAVPAGETFELDHGTYKSDPKDPIRGNASITFRKIAPAILFGWGNLIPRNHRRFSIPVEFGVVFHGQPDLAFNLSGKACDVQQRGCRAVDHDPDGIRDIANERAKIKNDISAFRFYPVASVGFAYNF
jgi:hypothetical protein